MLRLVAIIFASLCLFGSTGFAQNYPAKPVRIIAPFGPGGGGDVLTRILAQELSQRLGQSFFVENKAGGNGIIGAREAASAAPDGYSLFLATSTAMVINANLTKKLPYDPVRDFAAIAQLTTVPYVLVASSAVPADSVKALADFAKSAPTPLSYASGSTPAIVAGALFAQKAGIRATHVPYKATVPALTDVMTDRVSFMFSDFSPVLQQLTTGKIKALAVTTKHRSALLPNVPTMSEAGFPDFEILGWVSLCAPAGTPKEIVTLLNRTVKEILDNPEVAKKILALGMEPTFSTPEQHDALLRDDIEKWALLSKLAGLEQQ